MGFEEGDFVFAGRVVSWWFGKSGVLGTCDTYVSSARGLARSSWILASLADEAIFATLFRGGERWCWRCRVVTSSIVVTAKVRKLRRRGPASRHVLSISSCRASGASWIYDLQTRCSSTILLQPRRRRHLHRHAPSTTATYYIPRLLPAFDQFLHGRTRYSDIHKQQLFHRRRHDSRLQPVSSTSPTVCCRPRAVSSPFEGLL